MNTFKSNSVVFRSTLTSFSFASIFSSICAVVGPSQSISGLTFPGREFKIEDLRDDETLGETARDLVGDVSLDERERAWLLSDLESSLREGFLLGIWVASEDEDLSRAVWNKDEGPESNTTELVERGRLGKAGNTSRPKE